MVFSLAVSLSQVMEDTEAVLQIPFVIIEYATAEGWLWVLISLAVKNEMNYLLLDCHTFDR